MSNFLKNTLVSRVYVSQLLSVTCAFILVSILVKNMESSSALLSATLIVWLLRTTLQQISAANRTSSGSADEIKATENSLLSGPLTRNHLSQNFAEKLSTYAPLKLKSSACNRAMVASFKKFINMSIKALVVFATLLLRVFGVKDDTLKEKRSAHEFYRDCWQEDLKKRRDSGVEQKLKFGVQRLFDALFFVYEDSFISRTLRKEYRLLRKYFGWK